jgi:putative ABC transport system permease protein
VFLAFKEMQRSKVRFGLLIAAVGLLVFLILFQQALQTSLLRSFTGAIQNQTAPVLVYSVDGQRVLQGSVSTPSMEATISATPEVAEAARLSVGTFTVRADDDLVDATLLGYERADLGGPSSIVEGRLPESAGEVAASEEDRSDGFGIGDVVTVEPGGLTLTVVGLTRQAQLNVGPTLFTTYETFLSAVTARNPDAGSPLPNAIAVRPSSGVSAEALVKAVNAQDESLDALTRSDAADKAPGVSQVRQSFQLIFLLYGLVVPLVTGLFFLIVTFQKANALTLLRALGAPGARLVRSLLLQVVVVIGGGLVVGAIGYALLTMGEIGGLALSFEVTAVLFWSIALLVLGTLSSLVAAKRVLAIDPLAATTGAGVGR